MSVVSSVLSTRSTGWRINVRFSSLMDSIFAIGFGLGLRFVVDTVSHHDFKLTGTLVGLWEGVIMLHFLKKMPKSSDPYIAYGVRLFIDLLFTESLARLVLVLIWTALGMVLADITPAIWDDVGLKRIWKSFRRDLYTISRIIPTVAFFPPARTVRFSPSREPSVIPEQTEVLSPSDVTNQETPLPNIDPPFAPLSRDAAKRRLPGYFHLDYSDTETDAGSVRLEYTPPGRTSRRLSVYPQRQDSDDSTSEISLGQEELDETNISSFPSDDTETGEPQSALPDASEIPEMQVEEEPLFVNTGALPVKPEDGEVTPTQRQHNFMPPTPSDSALHWTRKRDIEEPLPVRPPSEFLPQIPDFLEEATTEDWEKIEHEKPPTPPAKDKPVGFTIPKVPGIPPPEPPTAEQSLPAPQEEEGWDTLESQFLSGPPPVEGNPATEQLDDNNNTTRRQTLPPSYDDVDFDDIYDDPPLKNTDNDMLTGNLIDNDTDLPPTHVQQADAGAGSIPPLFGLGVPLANPWDFHTSDSQDVAGGSNEVEEAAQAAAAAAAEAARLQEEEDQKRIVEEAAQAERAQQEEEERKAQEKKAKKEAEKAEMAKKELDDDIARKKRAAEAEEAERQKTEQKKKDAEEARLRREEAAKKKAEKEVEKKRKEEEKAEKKRQEEEAKRLKKEAEAAEKKKKEEQEAEEKRREEAEKKRKEKEAELKRKEEELKLEEKRLQEEAKQQLKDEADKKAQEEERLKEEEKSKEEAGAKEENKEAEPRAPNALEADQTITNGNGDLNKEVPEPTQDDAALTQEQVLTPTMLSRNLEQPLQPAVATEAPPPVPDTVDEQSVISDAQPVDPQIRVERMLTLRAQMVDTQTKIEEMKLAGSDCSGLEKVLRKMERQAQRRYAAGTPLAEYLDDFDAADSVNLDILNAQKSQRKVAEKIEQLLSPNSQKLFFHIHFGKKPNDVKKQRPAITVLLTEYNLLKYTKEAGKKTTINVPENSFADWVTGYRIYSTQPKDDDEGVSALWR